MFFFFSKQIFQPKISTLKEYKPLRLKYFRKVSSRYRQHFLIHGLMVKKRLKLSGSLKISVVKADDHRMNKS